MRALEMPPTTAPSRPPAMASCVAELAVSGELVVTLSEEVVVVVVGGVGVVVETDWLAVTKAEDVEAEVEVEAEVGLSSVLPSEGRFTSVWTSVELREVREESGEVLWT